MNDLLWFLVFFGGPVAAIVWAAWLVRTRRLSRLGRGFAEIIVILAVMLSGRYDQALHNRRPVAAQHQPAGPPGQGRLGGWLVHRVVGRPARRFRRK